MVLRYGRIAFSHLPLKASFLPFLTLGYCSSLHDLFPNSEVSSSHLKEIQCILPVWLTFLEWSRFLLLSRMALARRLFVARTRCAVLAIRLELSVHLSLSFAPGRVNKSFAHAVRSSLIVHRASSVLRVI